jgi:cation diffusion facilitator family transporter
LLSWTAAFVGLSLKLAAWWATDSDALLADAGESTIDVLSATLLVFSLAVSRQPADAGHPWGHGKAEYFSAGVHGALTSATGIALVVVSAFALLRGGHQELDLGFGLVLSAAATVFNLVIAVVLMRAGRRYRSPALVADGRHNLADVWTTVGSWAGLGLAVLTGWWVLDPVVAGLVGINVLRVGLSIVRDSVDGLMDATLPPAELRELEAVIAEAMGDAIEYHDLRARRSSQQTFVEFHLVVDGMSTVQSSHQLCDQIEARILEHLSHADVLIHVEPETECESVSVSP